MNQSEKIETDLGIHQKWRKTKHPKRLKYVERLLEKPIFKNKIFVTHFPGSGKAYVDLTIFAAAKTIKQRSIDDKGRILITIDGLRKSEIHKFRAGLRKLGITNFRVRGGREESNELLRLTDMIAGLSRDHFEKRPYANKLFRELVKMKIVTVI